MKEYSLNEMQQMQEKALERVRNMQTRANEAVRDTAFDSGAEKTESPKPKTAQEHRSPRDSFYNAVKSTPRQNHIKMPVEMPENIKPYESFREYFEPENKRAAEEKKQTAKANLMDDVLNEPDKALLFALLLLMQSDKADEELMMSLLYIMM